MSHDMRLVMKGKTEPYQGLIEQGRYQVLLAEQLSQELAEHNWRPEQTAEMKAEIAALDSEKFRQLDERSRAKETTRNEGEAIAESKKLITRVRNLARQVVRKNPDAGVLESEFHANGPLGRSASRISEYLGRLRVVAAKLDTAFAPYFKQALLSKLIDEARAKLDAASATQEVDLAALPEDTAAVYERKGRLLEHIEDLNAIARNAFFDDPMTRAKFNKDILNRSRRKRAGDADPTPGPTPPSA